MFPLIYYKKINKTKMDDTIIDINTTNLICTLCFEEIMIDDYYNYDNSIYIHTCNCKPNFHFACFKQCMKNRPGCIICNARIFSKTEYFENCNDYILFMVKYLILLIFSICVIIILHESSIK